MRQLQALHAVKQFRHQCSAASVSSCRVAYTTTTCETAAAISPTPNLYLNDAVSSASARKQGWLAGLAVAAVCVVASNIERAPVTRRPQLIFNIYKSPPASGESSLMPGVYEYNELGMLKFCPDWKMPQSQQAGDQLLRTAHHKVTQAVASLAASDPAFQRCLATTPNKVELSPVNFDFGRDALGQGTVRLNEDGLHMLDFGSPFDCKRANAIGIEIPSSYFLCQQTAEEAMTGIAKELAHVLANHLAESKSCKLLLDTALGAAAVAALAGGIGFWPLQLIFWGRLIGKDWMVNTWLHRQQVYEADAIAATITIASGADPHSILTSMQRAYIADATSPAKAALQLVRKQRVHWHLAKLQSLLPNSTIPQSTISDSSGLQLVTAAAAKEISSASSQVKGECRQSIVIIRDCLVEELCCLRSPYGAWTDINPHWLDRIAHVEHLLEGKTSSGDNSTSSSSEVWTEDNHSYRNFEQLLTAYQQSPSWTNVRSAPTCSEDPEALFSSLQAVCNMSASSLAKCVNANRASQFSWPIYWKAFERTLALPECVSNKNIQHPSFR